MSSEFLAELFSEASDLEGRSALVGRARGAAEQSDDVRFVRAMFVPDDEMCFLFFEASSSAAVVRLAEQAVLPIDRVVRTESGPGDGSAEETERREAP
jgi:hypothetical protein